MNDTKHVPTLGSLFDGIGGFPLAAVQKAWRRCCGICIILISD